jgi:ADP-ribose pyrophosphatase YjhB (NUDIX family)
MLEIAPGVYYKSIAPCICPIVNYCSHCGEKVVFRVPEGDTLPRYLCEACGAIHYLNPRLVIGTLPEWEDRILLCRRAIEPRRGYWTLPAGFMELGETAEQAAIRETLEEANARVELSGLFTLLSVPHVDQVHLFYRAQLLDLDFCPGPESLEVALFTEAEIPWKDISFRTVSATLKHYLADRGSGKFVFRAGELKAQG